MSSSEVTVSSGSRQVIPASQELHFQETMVTYSDNNMVSSYDNHQNDTVEEFPRYTTKELRDHFERTIEEAAAQKPIKIGCDINRSKWSSNMSNKLSSEVCKEFATESTQATVMDYEDFPPPPAEDSEYLPPPPPDLLQIPSDSENIPVSHPSYEPQEPVNKPPHNREAIFKQKGMSELKRIYKHIHPEVRKNIEKEFYSEYTETENNQLDSQLYTYEENDLSSDDIYDEEYEEWEEIRPGEVQAIRLMFENTPLDAIKDETPDEEEDNNHKKITHQEIILGKDVRRTAWMFETKPIDELGSLNPNSTEYKNKFNKFDKGDVRAAAWLFETQTMDTLNKMHKEEDLTKEIVFTEADGNASIYMIDSELIESLGHTETIDESHLLSLRSVLEEISGEVKIITSTFDTQFKCVIMGQSSQMLEIKSVRKIETELENSIASRWLFDTQPLDLTNREFAPLKLVCSLSMEDSNKGDWGRWLFEIKTLNSLHEWQSLQMEKKYIMGADVRKHRLVFETQSKDSPVDVRPESIEEIIGGNVRSARDFFETSPRVARKNGPEVGKLKKATVIEEMKGDVRHQKLRFESQPLEQIREDKKDVIRTVNVEDDLTQEDGTSCRADVRRNCWVFETQPMDTLKDDSNTDSLTKEEIIAGNVRSAREYFEMIPSEDLKELAEVGKLKKTVPLNEEKGDVRHQKWLFESQPLEQIREEKKEVIRMIDLEEIDKVDVSNYKQIFESTEVETSKESQMIDIEGVRSGSVKSNKNLFESSALYAMQDNFGHFHEVKTVRREEVVKGDVTTYKWMFETRPIDQFNDSVEQYQIIKGISKQEVESGNVKTAKWLFETQPLDAIKYFSNIEDEETVKQSKTLEIVKGDVKTCKWLFETKPMNILFEKVELKGENDESEEIRKGDVKTCTWLFETQTLDSIHDETETVLKTRGLNQEDIRGKDVKMACFLFETENMENLTGEEKESYKCVTEIDIASGDVSRKKYIFENQTSDIMTSSSDEVMQKLKRVQTEDIQRGNVVNCKWLFENQSIDQIHDIQEDNMSSHIVHDVQRGDVNKGRFIFETFSLDKIHEDSSETENIKIPQIIRDEKEKGDVRNYTMMFETQPLYAIQDKEGHYHEVTTVTSEEMKKGDVVGTRWLFETKPLDAIKDTDEVFVIKSVTQQDVQKGDVTSAKWKFETQPLDRIAEEKKHLIKTVDDIQGGNVRVNKQRFETDTCSEGSVRTVNVSEIQRGDVRTAKWRFETQSIDKIRSISSENLIETVKKEDIAKGDVRHSVWLFEKNPLDHIKEVDEDENISVIQEEIPKADVKTTTWLFETTPFDGFSEAKVEKTEILGKSIKETLEELYSQKMVNSRGMLIEADEIGDVRMAKYQLMNKQTPEIQREEIIKGDLQTIMMNLLNRKEKREQQIVVDSEEKGNISSTVEQLFNQERESNVEKEDILHGDIQEAINNLFSESGSAKQGILIQEDEKGDVRMTLYSLLHKNQNVNVEKEDVVKGDIKSTLERLSSSEKSDKAVKIKIDDAERGNVNFYSTCIESGALDYLKQLQLGPDETLDDTVKKEKIIGGDIKSTKSILGQHQMQIERTVEDVIPGDVHNALKVFMAEPTASQRIQKEEIVKGDLKAALSSLSESANQTVVVEKEEVIKGNIPKALRCLERAQRQHKEVDKPDIIPGNIRGALRSLEKSATSRVGALVEDLVPGDVKATLKSLELAKQAVKGVDKEEIMRGDINMAMQSLQEASSEKKICQQEIDVQGDVKGTIQLFMEPPLSPRAQQKFALEDDIKGDIKMSIKSLYETQEQNQEKEEVIKGDVKGTIKSLMETAQRETPKVRHGAYRRVKVKQSPPVKNLKPDSQRNIQKIKTAKQVETSKEINSITNQSDTARIKTSTVVEHKTITQNHGIKTVKTEFRNLKSNQKGMVKLSKTKLKTDNYMLKPQALEPDLPLPPPPAPVTESDFLPPPPPSPLPPNADTDGDHLPPPPPPLTGEQDFLPPPPPQQELESIPMHGVPPSLSTAQRMTVKKVKAPALHQFPKMESKAEYSKKQQMQPLADKTVQTIQNETETTMQMSKMVSREIPPPPPESPRPLRKVYIAPVKFTPPPSPPPLAESPLSLRKVYIAPVKFTPPPSPPPFMRGKASKFTTPLIKAEEKYRKLMEEKTPPATPSPTFTHDSVSATLEMLSSKDQVNHSISGITQEESKNTFIVAHSDSSMQVLVSDTTQSNVRSQHDKITVDSAIVSSTKQQLLSNETTKLLSSQNISSVSAVTQYAQATTQKTSSSKQTAQLPQADKVLSFVTDVSEHPKKDTKTQKTKTSNKSDDKKKPENKAKKVTNYVSKDETNKIHVSSNRSQENVSDQKTENTSPNTNGKAGKQTQKSKKNNKQDKPAETNKSNDSESVSQDLTIEVIENAGIKQELERNISFPAGVITPVNNPSNQPETPAPAKKKKKSKKSKGTAQQGQGKENVTELNIETMGVTSDMTQRAHETIAEDQIEKRIKEEHVQIKREAITTDRKDDQKSLQQKALQTQGKGSQKKEVTVTQQSAKEQPKESQDVPITVTGKSEQNELVKSTTERTKRSQRHDVQVLISQITEIQGISEKTHSKSVKTILDSVPDWIITQERKHELEQSAAESDAKTSEEIILNVRKLAESKLMDLAEEAIEKHEERISNICIGFSKIENQILKKNSHESSREEMSLCKSIELRAPSPSLRMRPPSPAFVTVESTRRTDSPQRVTPSPTLFHRPPTPPTPPLRRCDTPTSRITRITPSPTFDKAENLARLKEATAKLSQVVTPPPLLTHQITEKKSEVVELPSVFHQQIKSNSQVMETSSTPIGSSNSKTSITQSSSENDVLLQQDEPYIAEDSDDSDIISTSVKEKREFFERTQKAEPKKIIVGKEPINITEQLGADTEKCEAEKKNSYKDEPLRTDLTGFVNKFESPDGNINSRNKLIVPVEGLHNDSKSSDCNKERVDTLQQEMPSFNIQAIRNVFELHEKCFSETEERNDQEELVSSLGETTADTSKLEKPHTTKGSSRQSTPLSFIKNDTETIMAQPSGVSETKTTTEHFSNIDEFGNKVTGTMTAVTQHSESVSTQSAPFSYADAVKKKTVRRTETYDEDATEKLLRNFHKTWTESETVFKNLGYTVSEETSSQAVLNQTKTFSSGNESMA